MTSLSKLGLVLVGMMLVFGVACQNKKGPETAKGLNRIHFDFDKSSIRPDMAKIMDANAQYLKKHKNTKVLVAGNCDNRGTNEYNIALGDRRAKSAANYLVNKGVDAGRIKTVSYGEERPLESGNNEAAWYMNRRADFTRQ